VTEPNYDRGGVGTLQSTFTHTELRPRPAKLVIGPTFTTLPGIVSPLMKPFDTWTDTVTPNKPEQKSKDFGGLGKTRNQELSMPVVQLSMSENRTGLIKRKKGLFDEIKEFKLKGEPAGTIAEGSECTDNMMSPGLQMHQRHIYHKDFESPPKAQPLVLARRPHANSDALMHLPNPELKQHGEAAKRHSSKSKLMRLGSFSDDGKTQVGCIDVEQGHKPHRFPTSQVSKSIIQPEQPYSALVSNRRNPVKVLRVLES
jgi:hypothetical protein